MFIFETAIATLAAAFVLCADEPVPPNGAPAAGALPVLTEPVRLLSAGAPIAVHGGHAAPCVVDFNRDGRKDLVIGQFKDGKARLYLNVGTDAQPQFDTFTWLRAGDADAAVPPICCMGFDPQFADIDADGHLDLISGRYAPGVLTLFAGTPTGFRAGVPIDELLGPVERDAGGAHPAHACANLADWDADGDLDLVVGSAAGAVYFNRNQGTPSRPRFGWREPLLAAGLPLRVATKSDPLPVDWDGDGVLDLLVGDECAEITFFRGTKTVSSRDPALAAGVPIVSEQSKGVVPGYRVRLAAADWNDDGKLDLLVGNCVQEGATITGHVYLLLRK